MRRVDNWDSPGSRLQDDRFPRQPAGKAMAPQSPRSSKGRYRSCGGTARDTGTGMYGHWFLGGWGGYGPARVVIAHGKMMRWQSVCKSLDSGELQAWRKIESHRMSTVTGAGSKDDLPVSAPGQFRFNARVNRPFSLPPWCSINV